MMARYFAKDGRILGECLTDSPRNPDGLEVVTVDDLPGDVTEYIVSAGRPVHSKGQWHTDGEERARKFREAREFRAAARIGAMAEQLRDASHSQISTWVDSEFPDATQAQKRFFKVLAAVAAMNLRDE